MSIFGGYASYYDLLYRGKDYPGEARYVVERVREHAPGARELLELGCGSGMHALEFAHMGYDITGLDISEAMLERAALRAAGVQGVRFLHADARSCRLGRRFDAVVALFHVMSYQTSDANVEGALRTAAEHLPAGAPFVFDFWYGPAVLAQRPEARVRSVEDAGLRIVRTAEPRLREDAHCVDVRYTLHIERGQGAPREESLSEVHTMRYFFLPELESLLRSAGLRLAAAAEMQTGAPLGEATWSACAVALRV